HVPEQDYQYSSFVSARLCERESICTGFRARSETHRRNAHYVTPIVDAGPIREQDVIRVTNRHTLPDLMRCDRILLWASLNLFRRVASDWGGCYSCGNEPNPIRDTWRRPFFESAWERVLCKDTRGVL